MTLYHYTCSHAADRINATLLLLPMPQFVLPGEPRLIWLTDLDEPDVKGLGLTRTITKCDRTEHRYRALDASDAVRFGAWAEGRVPFATVCDLVIGRKPQHWYVSEVPVPVEAA